jgi:tetratricopeptide (TPR) repeat protein
LQIRSQPRGLKRIDKGLKLDPTNADAWFEKGAAFTNLGRFEEALQCCDRALEIDPQNATAQEVKRSMSSAFK